MSQPRRNRLDTGMNGARRIAAVVGMVVWVILGLGIWFLDVREAVKVVVLVAAVPAIAALYYAYRKLDALRS